VRNRGRPVRTLRSSTTRFAGTRAFRTQEDGIDDLLQVAVGDWGEAIAEGDHFALLGKADAAVKAAGGLGEDGLVGPAAAAADGAAAAMEEAEADPGPPGNLR